METMETPQTGKTAEESKKEAGMNVGRAERTASMVSGIGLAAYGVSQLVGKRFVRGAAMALAGGYLVYRGKTGRCSLYRALGVNTYGDGETGVDIKESVTVSRPRGEVYRYWRKLENLPQFMKYPESVEATGDNRYHWVAKTPGKIRIEWDAEITEDRENELIRWRSVPGSRVHSDGEVRFGDAKGGDATEVVLEMVYYPPGGTAGASFAKLFNFVTARLIQKELNRFKELMEGGGKIPKAEGQPATA